MLAASLLPASAFAQVRVAPPSAGALAWAGPIAGAVGEAGAGGVAQLESLSISRLAAPLADGRLTMIASPVLLNPLVETLAEAGVSPAEFPDLPLEFKMTILRNAAVLTEERLNMKVWNVVLNTNKGIGRSAIGTVARETASARETSLYLNDRTMEGLVMMEERVKKFHAAREEASREFLQDLPGKIAAGLFRAETLLQTEDDGGRTLWKTEGDSPERAYATPEAAFDARLETLALMPPGPWSAAEASLLHDALFKAMSAGTISPSRWTVRAYNALYEAQKAGLDASSDSRLTLAASRLAGKGATPADVLAVEKFYMNSYDRAARVWPVEAKILAALQTGAFGLPSWKALNEARQAVGEKLARREMRLMLWGISAGALASVLPASVYLKIMPEGWAAAGAFAVIALIVASFAASLGSMFRRFAMDEHASDSRVASAMREYFSRKP